MNLLRPATLPEPKISETHLIKGDKLPQDLTLKWHAKTKGSSTVCLNTHWDCLCS